jgi:hypothetical protein
MSETEKLNPPLPKKIHYVWLGRQPLQPLSQRCLASWRKYLPDWEIKKWDESNSPMNHPFVAKMMNRGLYAFASDYIRLHALMEEGGLYLDTDVELLCSPDSILEYKGLTVGLLSLQNRLKKCSIGTSWVSAPSECPWVSKIKVRYENLEKAVMNNTIFTREILPAFGCHEIPRDKKFDFFEASGARIYHPDYLNPVEQGLSGINTPVRKPNSVAIHHATGNWGGSEDPKALWKRIFDMRLDRKLLRPIENLLKRVRS